MFLGPLKRASKEEQAAYLLIWVGQKGREIFNAWGLTEEEEEEDPSTILRKFKDHTTPKTNKVFARYIFHERRQKTGETLETFTTDLRNMVKDCGYSPDMSNEMVRDRIVAGIQSADIREKLLNEGDKLKMESAIDIAITHETTKQHLASMANLPVDSSDIDAIRTKYPSRANQQAQTKECRNCGGKHGRRECPAFGQKCHFCHKLNHWASVCLAKRQQLKAKKAVHIAEKEEEENDALFIATITGRKNQPNAAYADIWTSSGDTIRFKIDTGAQANIIPFSIYKHMSNPPPLQPSTHIGYTGQPLDLAGSIRLDIKYKDQTYNGIFHIARTSTPFTSSQPILGLQACTRLNIIRLILSVSNPVTPMTKTSILNEYRELFSGLGELEGEVTLHFKPGATPVVHPARRVPHAIKDHLKKELVRMETIGVIERVSQPTDWVNSLVVVEKLNSKLRICLDPRDLNNAIKRPHYPVPTLDDVISRLAGAKVFSKLDASSGYWQLKLSKESSFLTTFNTPFGRYKFKRLPFGIICSQDEFQHKMDEIFEDLPGVVPLVDDILITGKTQEEHEENLRAVLQRAGNKNLKLNPEKLEVGSNELKYFGHIISADGLKPDPLKMKVIKDMPPPTNKKELQTLLGTVTYLAKFAPNLSEITKPMRDLLKDDIEFIWDSAQQKALEKTKETILSQPVLAFFDPSKSITLQVDASKYGRGAVLMQGGRPVAFASKSLTSTEQNYAQIEKELYAIVVFGCKRFHQFLYGQKITVQSDHKPLEIIARKPFASAPPRLQRMFLQLQKYNLDIIHVPGKDIPMADTLSRKFLQAEPDEAIQEEDLLMIHSVIKNMPVSDEKTQELRLATQNDSNMQQLKTYIQDGWPESRDQCHSSVINMWNHRDELSIIEGLIFKGEKILVPKKMRSEMMTKLHSSHLGIEKTKERARKILFWPGMAADIHQYIATCPICIPRVPSNPKEPLISHDIPARPWQKVGTDIFSWNNATYLVTVDYYSRYFEVDELPSMTSSTVIRKLSAHFARHGIPETVVSDNGPQFTAETFKDFAAAWDFKHITSSPGYPQSNGLAEKTVQTVKRILDKAKAGDQSALLSILEYRSTPVDGFASPAQLLMGRQLRSVLPATSQQLKPKSISHRDFIVRRQYLQNKQKKYHDRTAHVLPPVKTDDQVYIQLSKGDKWQPAQVPANSNTPRSFVIQTSDGQKYRRNRRFIRQTALQRPPNEVNEQTLEPVAESTTCETTCVTIRDPYTTRSGRTIQPPRKLDM